MSNLIITSQAAEPSYNGISIRSTTFVGEARKSFSYTKVVVYMGIVSDGL